MARTARDHSDSSDALAAGRPARGFTLIELMVALAVFGFLMIGLTQGTKIGLAAWNAQNRQLAGHEALDSTDRALRLLIGSMAAGSEDGTQLVGHSDTMAFSTTLPQSVSLATRHAEIKLGLDDRHRLVMAWRPDLHERPIGPPPAWQEVELLSGVEHVVFSYRAPGSGAWRDDWREAVNPVLIRIHVAFPQGDPRHWPDLVVAPIYGHGGA